jgi:hypothetical protein
VVLSQFIQRVSVTDCKAPDWVCTQETNTSLNMGGVGIGVLGGVSAGYNLGPGFILFDVRYLFELTEMGVKFDGQDPKKLYRRHGLAFGIGYELWI